MAKYIYADEDNVPMNSDAWDELIYTMSRTKESLPLTDPVDRESRYSPDPQNEGKAGEGK